MFTIFIIFFIFVVLLSCFKADMQGLSERRLSAYQPIIILPERI